MLIAVRRMVESGNMVIFRANVKTIRKLAACDKIEPNVIVGKNGKRTEVLDENGMYVFKMKMKKKGKDDMDIGVVNKRDTEGVCSDEIEDPF